MAASAPANCRNPHSLHVCHRWRYVFAPRSSKLAPHSPPTSPARLATPIAELNNALWELVAAGLVTADGYDSLRALIDPRRKSASGTPFRMRGTNQRARNTAGRWSLLAPPHPSSRRFRVRAKGPAVRRDSGCSTRDKEIESAALVLLWRYGIVFRDLLERETTMPRWRELLGMFRRLEARGIVRGGRFVSGFQGEQFALPQAVESLRESRKQEFATATVTIAAADPANLVGIVVPGDRPPATAGRTVQFARGHFVSDINVTAAEMAPSLLQPALVAQNAPAQLAFGHD